MSWLRTTSLSFARQLSRTLDPRRDYEPDACYSSFSKHWQQAYDIILKSHPSHLHDDVLGVVNHLEQLSTLLVLEARARELRPGGPAGPHGASGPPGARCLECLLTENMLDKLYEWAVLTGKYENAVRLEELKLFGHLISHYSSQVIAAEPFLRPLLKLLSSFRNELPPPNVETQLVTVLNQLCVSLMQNMKFIDLFFLTAHTRNGSKSEFIIVRLLLASVHRGGRAGALARDALLLCAKMSARSDQLASYMLEGSDACPVLATGLSGLYSLLPRTVSDSIHRLTPDDVNQLHKLMLFVDSLEFCNAVAQVAHTSIKEHLLDLLYQGFLVPVLGPALLQTKGALQTGAPEQAAATLYIELAARCSTAQGLLPTVLGFLLKAQYDGVGVLQVLLARLDGDCQLSMASLSLIETLIDLNCEDVMLELIFKYLLNGNHLTSSHKHKISDPEAYRDAAVAYLSLTPKCCARGLEKTRKWADDVQINGRRVLDFKAHDDRRVLNGHDGIAMDHLVREDKFNYGNPNDTLFGNYHAYLCDARFEIVSRTIACLNWSSKYDKIIPKIETNNNSNESTNEINIKELDSLISICTSGYETLKTSDTSEKEPHSLSSLVDIVVENSGPFEEGKDSLNSFGESSGYDSFRYKFDEDEGFVEESFLKSLVTVPERCEDVPSSRNWRASAETIVGPLLSSLLKKSAALLESSISQNMRVTGVICKLVSFPTPLLTALLLCPGFAVQPNVPSLFQILSRLKDEVDELTTDLENIDELVDKARVFLIQREMTLVRTRGNVADDSQNQSAEATPPKTPETPRGESKRRSLSNSFSSMFGRRLSSSSPPTHPVQTPPVQKRLDFTQESYWNQSITLRSILNAVILDEWIKELSALSEEHALRLSAQNYEDDTFLRSVGL